MVGAVGESALVSNSENREGGLCRTSSDAQTGAGSLVIVRGAKRKRIGSLLILATPIGERAKVYVCMYV